MAFGRIFCKQVITVTLVGLLLRVQIIRLRGKKATRNRHSARLNRTYIVPLQDTLKDYNKPETSAVSSDNAVRCENKIKANGATLLRVGPTTERRNRGKCGCVRSGNDALEVFKSRLAAGIHTEAPVALRTRFYSRSKTMSWWHSARGFRGIYKENSNVTS